MDERRSHISAWSADEERRRVVGGFSEVVLLSWESLRDVADDLRDAFDDLRDVRQSSLEPRDVFDDLRDVRQSSLEPLHSSSESFRGSCRCAWDDPSMSHLLNLLAMVSTSISSSRSSSDEFRDCRGDCSSESSTASSSSSSASESGGDGGCTTTDWIVEAAFSKVSSRGLACRADRLVGLRSLSGLIALGLAFRETLAWGIGNEVFGRPRDSRFRFFS